MSTQPVIFDLKYTPYTLKKGATAGEIAAHERERAFFTMTGEDNIYKYMTTEEKQTGNSVLEYLQKNAGVFNDKGVLSQDEVKAMKERLKENKGNVWHGFVSLNKEQSKKIDTVEKCIKLVKSTFPQFFKEAHLGEKNIDLMCALHLDRPHHLHYHFVFWEKEPKYKGKDGERKYRYQGKISEKAIDNFFVRTGLFLKDDKARLYKTRAEAIKRLMELTYVKKAMSCDKVIRERILTLAKSLPEKGRLSYGSKDMEPYREKADEIVRLMLNRDKPARKAHARFYAALEQRKRDVLNICGEKYESNPYGKTLEELLTDLDEYRHKIDPKNITVIETIEEDYKRRQGNLVLKLCKFIKPEYYERKKDKKYRTGDVLLKKRLTIGRRNVSRAIDKFFLSFGEACEENERECRGRLQEIEKEMEEKRKQEEIRKLSAGGNGDEKG